MTSDFQLTVTRTIKASQKDLFEAWLNAEAIKEFMLPMPGTTVDNVKVDDKVGGLFSMTFMVGDSEVPIHGEYKKISKFDSLEFSWLSPHNSDTSVVSLSFKKLSDSETELTLVHSGLETEESSKHHEGGWTHIIDQLSAMF